MAADIWTAVDDQLERLIGPDPALEAVLAASLEAGLPPYQVSPTQGKLLYLLALMCGAKRILEIGTLGGYSAVWLARALPADGRLVTLEADARYAGIARGNVARAGLSKVVDVRVGRALDTLPTLEGPFDLFFLDADKPSTPQYLEHAIRLARHGSVIVADNVVRDGAIVDPDSTDPSVVGIRRFLDLVAADPRLSATAIQTVGRKGYDGFAIALVG